MDKDEVKKIIKDHGGRIYDSPENLRKEILRLKDNRVGICHKTQNQLYRLFTNRISYLNRMGKKKFESYAPPKSPSMIKPDLRDKRNQIKLYLTYRIMLLDKEIDEKRFEHYIRNLDIRKDIQDFVEAELDKNNPQQFMNRVEYMALKELEERGKVKKPEPKIEIKSRSKVSYDILDL